jgi:UDP-N-acetylglucosamine acyltransferase
MSRIHPSAVIDPRAELDADVEVGAFSVIGADTRIGSGTVIGPHVVIDGHTVVGRNNRFHPFASVTVNRGTVQDAGVTRIGSDNWVMAYVHIAHDCNIGNHTIFANSTNLAGHVQVGDWAILGGCTQVHQFCKIGAHAMTGAGTVVLHDIPPFVMTSGNSASAHGLNSEGLKRRGFSPSRLQVLRSAYKLLYKAGLTLDEARAALQRLEAESAPDCAADLALLNGFLTRVTRGIVR